jgi:hypothetical protein
MSNNNAYSRILKCMQRQGSVSNGFDMDTAEILSVDPISILYNNVRISSDIVVGGCMKNAEDLDRIVSNESGISTELKEGLKGILNTIKLQAGDKVIVQRVGNVFYIIGKAVG